MDCQVLRLVLILRPMNVTRLGVQPSSEGWLAVVPGVGGRKGCGQGLYLGYFMLIHWIIHMGT